MKVTICVDVNDADDVAAMERWRQTWGPQVQLSAENQGCGCCVDIWEVEAPEEAIQELPQSVLCSDGSTPEDRHKTPAKRLAHAKGCLAAAMLLAVGVGFLMLAILHLSIPYQDPTPELRAQYARDVESAKTLGFIGVTVFGCGLLTSVVVCYRWARRRIAERKNKRALHGHQ